MKKARQNVLGPSEQDEVVRGQGRGKVILLGEHAVVYGHPALAAALDRGAEVELRRLPAEKGTENLEDRLVSPLPMLNARRPAADVLSEVGRGHPQVGQAFRALLEVFSERVLGIELAIRLDIPPGIGLGGSAAAGIAIASAVARFLDRADDEQRIESAALAWERVFHGTPSGVDTALALHGGVGLYEKAHGLKRLELRESIHLAIANSGAKTSTREMVESVAEARKKDRAKVDRILEAIGALVRAGVEALEKNDLHRLGKAMNEDHAYLRELRLSTPRLETLREAALQQGALGAKLTGSGGGGAMIALARSKDHAAAIASSLAQLAFDTSFHELRS